MNRRVPWLTVPLAVSALLMGPRLALAAPLLVERVSVSSTGAQCLMARPGNITPDGRHVAFVARTQGWYPGDHNPSAQGGRGTAWLRDRQTRQTRPIGFTHDGALDNWGCTWAQVNSDASLGGFGSWARMAEGMGLGGSCHVFTRSLGPGVVTWLDPMPYPGGYDDGEYCSYGPCLSESGHKVVFHSDWYLGGGVIVYDSLLKTWTRVDRSSQGVLADSGGCSPAIAGDGYMVAFCSEATNLYPGVADGVQQVYAHRSLSDGVTELISSSAGGEPGGKASYRPALSGDGRYVAFASEATNLVRGDTNGVSDVFVKDRRLGTTTRVSVSSNGAQANGPSWTSNPPSGGNPCQAISRDGRYVVFESEATNLVPKDTNLCADVFVHDRLTGRTDRVSVAAGSVQADGPSSQASVSADGRFVLFLSQAKNLVKADSNNAGDVFVSDLGYSISGRVTDSSGVPLPKASAVGTVVAASSGMRYAYTDKNGAYSLTGLAPGSYTVEAWKVGYRPAPARTVTVGPSRGSLNFQLPPRSGDGVHTGHAVLVGVNDYGAPKYNLQGCVNDARDLRYRLLTGANWRAANVALLLDSAATASAVWRAAKQMADAADGDDVCLFFFSGHGRRVADEEPLDEPGGFDHQLSCHDWKQQGRIVDDVFGHWMNRLPTKDQIVVLDHCFSGGVLRSSGALSGAPLADATSGTRVTPSTAEPGSVAAGFLSDLFPPGEQARELADNGCGLGMAACRLDEIAGDDTAMKNGIFSYFLVEAMAPRSNGRHMAGDGNGDGLLTAEEAFRYAQPKTEAYAASRQHQQHPVLYDAAPARKALMLGPIAMPDLRWMDKSGKTAYAGEGVYSPNGERPEQAWAKGATRKGGEAVFNLSVENDSRDAQDVVVTASDVSGHWRLRCYDAYRGGRDVTSSVLGFGWRVRKLGPGCVQPLRVVLQCDEATPKGNAAGTCVRAWFGAVPQKLDAALVRTNLWFPSRSSLPSPAPSLVAGLCAVPARAGAEVTFSVASATTVGARILNLAGHPVRTLCRDRACDSGRNTLLWDARSDAGLAVPNGAYLVEVTAKSADGAQSRALAPLRMNR